MLRGLAIAIVVGTFVWIFSLSPTLALVLFLFFGMPFVLMGAFAVDKNVGFIALFLLVLFGLWLAPWFTLAVVAVSIVVWAGAS
jgi:ABC-type amino acid transport system permease subunit